MTELRAEKIKLGEGIYTVPDVARILKIPQRKVSYWVDFYVKGRFQRERNFQYHNEIGRQSVLNFHALVETFTFFHLKSAGVPTSVITEAHEYLSKRYKTDYPFAHANVIRGGGHVLFEEGGDLIRADKTQQLYIEGVIKPFCEKIRFGRDLLADRYYPLGLKTPVVVSPVHQFGQPTVEGTNILASTIYDLHRAKESKRTIKVLYDLTDKQVDAAIAYFAQAA